MNHFSVKLRLLPSPHHSVIIELIKLAIGNPTPEKAQKTLGVYEEPDCHLLGYYSENRLVALIGLQVRESHGVIKHISVLEPHQNQGIGKALITEAINDLKLKTCEAKTDEEGKGFYEKCDFKCTSFEGKYNMRYRCEWKKTPLCS